MSEPDHSTRKHWLRFGLLAGVPFGLICGLIIGALTNDLALGVALGILAGLMFGGFLASYFERFTRRQAARFKADPPDFGCEKILLEAPANHFMGNEGVGGYMWLTDGQIHFRSHEKNIQVHEWVAEMSEISRATSTRSLGILPNGLLLQLASGEEERFIVNSSADWEASINREVARRK